MHLMRLERTERLRFHADQAVGDASYRTSVLAEMAQEDAGSVQAAWSAFVPMLAHPVMATQAKGAMRLLDAAAGLVAQREPLAV